MKKWISLCTLVLCFNTIACDENGQSGFAPKNDLNIPEFIESVNGINEEVFNQVMDEINAVYEPIVNLNGDKLVVNRKWSDGTVNASAQRKGKSVIINMYGGLARHEKITRDGFALVVCHELGHHLGGSPKVTRIFGKWASNEGQSDYFATLKCFRKVYFNDNNAEIIAGMKIDPLVEQQCSDNWASEAETNLCIRSSMAAKSTTELLATLRNSEMPQFNTPDNNVVRRTDNSHPVAQCRLDTYFQGALCNVDMDVDLDKKDPNKGTCNRKNNDKVGLRSLCWFAPKN